ncbi:MAG TPA: redox-sensing transcriptional repressor Rex [Trueperaceae bacterium]|nr:redox-sensing transcriptional repressor Rex [Trueperaceae bacterium]
MPRGGARGTARDIPSATVGRLITYLRVLNGLESRGVTRVSSDLLAEEAQVSAFQVRKDLAYFGTFGTRGTGYTVSSLKGELKRILGLTRPWRVAIVGMGRLGQALADYPGLSEYDFELVAAFDVDERKLGTRHGTVVVRHMSELAAAVGDLGIEIVLLTVPVRAAQEAADAVVRAGVRGILNFAPTVVSVPPGVQVEPVDFLAALKRVSYFLHEEAAAAEEEVS